jgi:peroxiredoxin (alkyl hydroperoxide reductase subunit C)
MEESKIPLLGEKFPEVEVQTTHGRIKLPDEFKDKWFILFSHPGDFTPVCTTEFVKFAQMHEEFRKNNCELIGLSVDQVYSHIKWIEWIKENLNQEVKFPVIADEMGKLAKMLGMIHEKKGTNTVRAVFIVDKQAKIRVILYYPQEVGRNMDEILRTLKALQTTDENHVATPANWPRNDLIQDHVIIPPPADEKTAMERKGKENCFDWWFCHKKL